MWIGTGYNATTNTIIGWRSGDSPGAGEVVLGGQPPPLPIAPTYSIDPITLLVISALDRKPRTMQQIATDIFALTGSLPTPAAGTQKANIIANLFGGSPPLWESDAGPNASALSACYVAVTQSNGSANFNAAQQLIMAAIYCLDNPAYLVNPVFDPTIDVPGDQPA